MAAKNEKAVAPVYIAFRTFYNSLNRLKERGLPARVDASVFAGQSGSTISALLAAYRYLGLIDEQGRPTEALEALAQREEEERGELLKPLLVERYSFLQPPAFDLAGATTNQIEAAFREQGIGGSTISKAVSFFLAASQAAGMQISKHIQPPTVKRSSSPRTKRASKKSSASSVPDPVVPVAKASSAAEQLLAKFPDFDPTWGAEIKAAWFESFSKLRGAMLEEEKP